MHQTVQFEVLRPFPFCVYDLGLGHSLPGWSLFLKKKNSSSSIDLEHSGMFLKSQDNF